MSWLEIYDIVIIIVFTLYLFYQIRAGWIPLKEAEKDPKNKS